MPTPEAVNSARLVVTTLVTHGAGPPGSHLRGRFLAEGHGVIWVDHLLTGSPDNVGHCMRIDDGRSLPNVALRPEAPRESA